MEPILQRKPRVHFDATSQPSHVTFDDGSKERRNLPWLQYTQARWEYSEIDTIRVEIGDALIVIRGNKLETLFTALEEKTLLRVRAQPLFAEKLERKDETYVTSIRFLKAPSQKNSTAGSSSSQEQLGLG